MVARTLRVRFAGPMMVVAGLLALAGCAANPRPATGHGQTQAVTIHGERFHLELAVTPTQRHQGLSGRRHIDPHGGMLFVVPHPQLLVFVMRRCYVPIDLIYLDSRGRVLATYHMTVQPYDTPEDDLKPYNSPGPAQFVLELKGGTLAKLDLKAGERIDLPLVRLKQLAR